MVTKERLDNLPKKPGCYLMKDSLGEIIYVGKAKNLFNRVKSYFTGSHDAKTTKLVSNIDTFEYIITSSETEAYILEMNLIKKYRPKYNILLLDDKQYPYICITDEAYPKIYYTRDLSRKGKYYGPYPNSGAAKEVVDLINRIYPLRKCRVLPKKACLYYYIGQCLAPCINKLDEDVYPNMVNEIHDFLKGNIKDQLRNLEKLMLEQSELMNYEKALEYKKLIYDLNTVNEKQKMELNVLDTDVFGYIVDDGYISIQVFHIRAKKTVERNGFLFEIMGDPKEMFSDFIGQFYLVNNNPIPKEILIPEVDIESIDESIRSRIQIPKIGQKKEFVKLVTENAQEKLKVLIIEEKNKYERTLGAVIDLAKLLNIKIPHKIEAFDNSNIQGMHSVSAMVSYFDGLPSKKNYRKFKVKTVDGANDYETMNEVITRRYKKLKDTPQNMPDLIIVDGGKPQVNSALNALNDLGLNLPVLGLGKDDKHQTSYLVFNNKEIHIDKKSNLFFFLENLQDEVHRYAITFHHLVHTKSALKSGLDGIKGIGPVKKKRILEVIRTSNQDNFESNLKALKLTDEQIKEIIKLV